MAVMHIRRPREFTLPASKNAILKMLEELTPDDLSRLAVEFLEALEAATEKDDLLPVRQVLEAWHRTTLLRKDPLHGQLTAEAHDRAAGHIPSGTKGQTVDELRDEISRRRAS